MKNTKSLRLTLIILALLSFAVSLPALAQDERDEPVVVTNPAARFVVDALNGASPDAITEFIGENYAWFENSNFNHDTVERFIEAVGLFRESFPNLVMRVEDEIANEDLVAIRYMLVNERTDFSMVGSMIFRLDDEGRLEEVWNIYDSETVLSQLNRDAEVAEAENNNNNGNNNTIFDAATILAEGIIDLPAAQAFGEPGFHEVFNITATVPENIGATQGFRLIVALRDASRPDESCDFPHPLSGCATVDWSDSPSRPKVPPSGVFDNSITLALDSGERTYFLSESGALADQPDEFDPG